MLAEIVISHCVHAQPHCTHWLQELGLSNLRMDAIWL